ncbi:MAG: sulfur oxidation c-type cytochrome SoxA [Betaproteobacteria bacterium]|nr:sulfur oxidation c-type cytochrome SoxA [Betaproteobacteria bacterium]
MFVIAAAPPVAMAQADIQQGMAQHRQILPDGNPAELYAARGAALWITPRGPKKVSLEHCDLGMGPGVVKGAYTRLPRYFSDTDRVQDLESRLVTCMVALQGYSFAEATRNPFSQPGRTSPMEELVAWIASESRGTKMEVSTAHAKEQRAYQIGEKIFHYRAGPHDLACATCHGEDNKRIRLRDLPNLVNPADAQRAYTAWPGYRVSQGALRSFQWRLYDCFREQRFPELEYISDASIALTTFLAKNANGGVFDAPTLKRQGSARP